jgi:hypothetical protein
MPSLKDLRREPITTDVGKQPKHVPLYGSIKLSGSGRVMKQLGRREQVHVVVRDMDGNVVSELEGRCEVSFAEHEDPDFTERIHSIKLKDSE